MFWINHTKMQIRKEFQSGWSREKDHISTVPDSSNMDFITCYMYDIDPSELFGSPIKNKCPK